MKKAIICSTYTVASGKTIIGLGCFEKGQIKLIKKNENFEGMSWLAIKKIMQTAIPRLD